MADGQMTYLRLDQHQIDKEYHKVMFYVFIAEASAVLADGKADSMAAGSIICARVFGVKGLDGIATFYADWHRIYVLDSSAPGVFYAFKHVVVFRF
jgi:hypothetical protein